jgi:hypothetical protein
MIASYTASLYIKEAKIKEMRARNKHFFLSPFPSSVMN